MKNITILDIKLNIINKKDLLAKIQEILKADKPCQLVTLNPEMILEAEKDDEFKHILNQADINVADGVALKFAGYTFFKNISRITGADLVKDVLKIAEDRGYTVGVVNWEGGLSSGDDIMATLRALYPGLNIKIDNRSFDSSLHSSLRTGPEMKDEKDVNFYCDILLVTLGAPWQEKFIYENKNKIGRLKLAIGIGGALDFLTGKIKRAPKILRTMGLEWLWRLIQQPWRIKRIYRAVIVFPFKFIIWRIGNIQFMKHYLKK